MTIYYGYRPANDRNTLSHRYDEGAYQQALGRMPSYAALFKKVVKTLEDDLN